MSLSYVVQLAPSRKIWFVQVGKISRPFDACHHIFELSMKDPVFGSTFSQRRVVSDVVLSESVRKSK
jgi:hypothetical protein